jgi:4-amino-4-deoxy-L-arabinose transferase-like glycosyltransferase
MNASAGGRAPRWFPWALAAVALGAFVLRVVYVLVERRDFEPVGDAYFYHHSANLLADGEGFVSPFYFPELHREAAEHPPLYVLYLAVPSLFGMQSVLAHVLWSCVIGTATVVLVGLVGREVGGARLGIIAAALAACYPNIWAPDGMLQAETLAMFTAVLAVFLAYRYLRRPRLGALVAVGAAAGAGALARSELVLFVPLLLVPLVWRTRAGWRDRLRWIAAGAGAAVLVIAPWSVYNVTRFERPVLLSAQMGPLLAAANCDSTYYGPFNGYYDINCNREVNRREGITLADDQSVEDAVNRREALEYVRGHLGKLPYVAGVRLARMLGLYRTSLYVHVDSMVEGRELWISWAALWSFYGLTLLAVAGAVVFLRRRPRPVPLFPALVPMATVVVTVLLTYASTRFRAIAEPMIALLAAVALEEAGRVLGIARPAAPPDQQRLAPKEPAIR